MTDKPRKPEFSIRDGAISATTWRKEGEFGTMFTTSIERAYQDKETGEWRYAKTFSGTDLLKVSRLAGEAYEREAQLRQHSKNAREHSAIDRARNDYLEHSKMVDQNQLEKNDLDRE